MLLAMSSLHLGQSAKESRHINWTCPFLWVCPIEFVTYYTRVQVASLFRMRFRRTSHQTVRPSVTMCESKVLSE